MVSLSELAGPIRIAAPTAFGSTHLVEALRPFQLAHPQVTVDLRLADHRVSVVEEGFDLALRFGRLEDSTLIARRLMSMRLVVFAAPDYLQRHGRPAHPRDLVDHNCLLQMASVDPEHWKFDINTEIQTFRVTGSFRANAPRAIAEMAAGGLGIGMCPIYVARPYLDSGALELLFEDMEATAFGLYAVYPPSRHLTARIRALIDHLAEYFASAKW